MTAIFLRKLFGFCLLILGAIFLFLPFSPGWLLIFAGLAFGALEVLRPAPKRAFRLPFSVWMALARANAEPADEESPQGRLGAPSVDG